jgi:type II secretory pathway predicted ATPase ExeA
MKMVEAFYNLKKLPFQKNIEPKDLFMTPAALELKNRLEHIRDIRGMMLLTGSPGVGKTLNLKAFVDQLNANLYKFFYIPLSTVTPLEFYSQICFYLTKETSWKKSQLFRTIQNGVKDYVANHKKIPVIILDEAHLLKNENFQELQIITNFDMDTLDPFIVIISGQSHLSERLMRPIHESFNQRFALKFVLPPLTKEETPDYIDHHLHIAGRKDPIFDQNAVTAIHQNAMGRPRVINTLALNAMTIGAIEKKDLLTEEEVYRASQES